MPKENENNAKYPMKKKEAFDFIAYVDSFYNPKTGIYPIKGATIEVIRNAVEIYLQTTYENFLADSFDREQVREIILQNGGVLVEKEYAN